MILENAVQIDNIRLKELAASHLFVNTDAKSHIKEIPTELVEGSYRWRVYIYSNLFRKNNDLISVSDKVMFIRVSKKFLIQHMNCWSRQKVNMLDLDKYQEMRQRVLLQIYTTDSFYVLRVCLYLLAAFKARFFCYDEYMLELCPWLRSYSKI